MVPIVHDRTTAPKRLPRSFALGIIPGMPVTEVRGYVVSEAWKFLRANTSPDTFRRVTEGIPADEPAVVAKMKPADWYPVEHIGRVWTAIGKVHDDDDQTRALIIDCGEQTARAAAGTFLRLMMRVLTPNMLARKLPTLWAHDFRGGHWVADTVDDNRLVGTLSDVDNVVHIGPIAIGFIGFVMKQMGKKGISMSAAPWSSEQPSPSSVRVEFTWQ